MQQIDRREALKRLTMLVGGTLSASTVAGVLSGCTAGEGDAYTFLSLDQTQRELVASIADTVIPTTDTPGARDVGVDRFIDKMLDGWMDDNEKARFLTGLTEFAGAFERQFGVPFDRAEVEDRLTFMTPLDIAASEGREMGIAPLPFFATMKELIVVGYYTSEIGATRELRHQMIFDRYDGDVTLTESDRAWA